MGESEDLEQRFFIAAILHDSRRYRIYSLYFINNTQNTIDSMIVVSPGLMEAKLGGATIDEVGPGLVDNVGTMRYEGIPPRSYVELTTFFDWDFDWSSSRYVMLKTCGKEEHLRFNIERDILSGQEHGGIPVLGRAGYTCLGESASVLS